MTDTPTAPKPARIKGADLSALRHFESTREALAPQVQQARAFLAEAERADIAAQGFRNYLATTYQIGTGEGIDEKGVIHRAPAPAPKETPTE